MRSVHRGPVDGNSAGRELARYVDQKAAECQASRDAKTKRSQTLPEPLQQKLAEQREEEKTKLTKAREAQRAESAEKQKQKKAIELAKLEADAARHKSRAEAKIANAKLAELQLQKQKNKIWRPWRKRAVDSLSTTLQ